MQRRNFLRAAAVTAAASTHAKGIAAGRAVTPNRVIDTHTHFYDPTRPQGVPWPPDNSSPLYRKVMPKDFLAAAKPVGVRETVVVEASEWVEDNQWVLDLAEQNKSIVGLVGNLNPNDPKFKAHLRRLSKNPLLRGLRWRDKLVALDGDLAPLIVAAKQLAACDLELDLLVPYSLLPSMQRLAQAVPDLRIVINHAGRPGDPQALPSKWKENVAQIAKLPNVFMKASGLIEQATSEFGKSPTDTEYYLPVLDYLWDHFGEDRLIYGSNWPVSQKGGTYATSYRVVEQFFSGKGNSVAEKYFCKNSQAVYRWIER